MKEGRLRHSLLKTGHPTTCHDGLKTIVDMNTQEQTNCVIATLHITFNMFLHTHRGRWGEGEREMGGGGEEGYWEDEKRWPQPVRGDMTH